ncbi:MAG TPA: CBS domain-containing protein [Anaerohalosphaeraceae bacterium]|nr:CBS domain-containing protein [Anaerohalosphaeraceae bacterium]
MKVRDIMSSPVETIDVGESVVAAARKMKSHDIGVLPVMKNNRVIGMITDRDIVLRIVAEKEDPAQVSVGTVMTLNTVCCSEETDIEEAARLLEIKQIHRLLVLDKTKAVCGILSVGDLACKLKDEHMLSEILERICEPASSR